ncbi:AAA family ATPase [Schinkia sp. CFF1]
MKITSVHIYGFGQFEDKLIELKTGNSVHLFYGRNEAGKSTIMAFIHMILFGFPTRNQTENRYEPKTGAKYGGKVTIETEEKIIMIERVKGRSTGELVIFREDGTVCGEEELRTLFKGLDRALYQSIFSFGFKGLQAIENISSTELSHYLFTAGATGGQALFELEKKITKKLDELYKPSGRKPVLNEKLMELEYLRNELKKWEDKINVYNKYVEEQEQLKMSLLEKEATIANLQTLNKEYEKKLMLEPHITERKKWQIQLSGIYDFEPFPVNGLERLGQLQTEVRPLKGLESSLLRKIDDLQKEIDACFFEEKYIAQEAKVRSLKERQKVYEMLAIEKEKINLSLRYEQEEISTLFEKLGKAYSEDLLNRIDTSLAVKEQLKNLTTQEGRLKDQQKFLDDQFNKAKADLELTEVSLQSTRKQKQKKDFPLSMILLSIAITAFGVTLWFISESAYPLIIMAVLLIGMFLHKFTAGNVKSEQFAKNGIILNQKERHFEDVVKQYESWEQEYRKVEQSLSIFCTRYKLPEGMPVTLLTDAFEWIEELKKRIRTKKHLLTELDRIENELAMFTADVEKIIHVFNMGIEPSLVVLNQMINVVEGEKEKQLRAQKLLEKLKEYYDEKTLVEQQIIEHEAEIKNLFSSAGVDDEDAFRKKGIANDEYKAIKAKLQSLDSYLQSVLKAGEEHYIIEMEAENIHYEQEVGRINQELAESSKVMKQLQIRLADLTVEIKSLEEGTTYSELVHRYEALKDEFQREAGEWAVYKVAKDLIDRTKGYYRKVRLPHVIQSAQDYFSFLTFGKYPSIFAPTEDSGFIVERQDGLRFAPNELSQATTEQLYLSLRLSLARNFHSITPLPIIIDDSFVNFDLERTKRALKLIQEIGKEHQVLFFTCHQHLTELFDEAEIINL